MAPLTPERLAYLGRVVDGETPGPPHTELIYDTVAGLLDTIETQAGVVARLLDGWGPANRMQVVEAGSPLPEPVRVWMHRELRTAESELMTDAEQSVIDAIRGAGPAVREDTT